MIPIKLPYKLVIMFNALFQLWGKKYSLIEVMSLLGLSTIQQDYLNPAIEAGLIERTISDKPKVQSKDID